MQTAHREGFSLTLLPRQLLAPDEIERAIEYMKRLSEDNSRQLDIVVRIESSKQVRARALCAMRQDTPGLTDFDKLREARTCSH